jgi:phosphatidylglycerol:prolipoprotein diacylglycerol transferase
VHPVLVDFLGVPIYGYGVMLGLSCVIGAHLAVWLSARSGIPEGKAWRFAITVIVIGLVGGRAHDVWINTTSWAAFFDKMTQLSHSGRTAYGAFLSATIGAVIFSRVLEVPFWRFADAVSPTMAIGLGITRIGCFLWGCDYGPRTDAWGVCFPKGSPAWEDQVALGLIKSDAPRALPVFPIQFVESFVGFAIGALCIKVWFSRPRREGAALLTFFLAYGLCRAALELFREDSGRGTIAGMSTSMAIGLGTAAAAAVAFLVPQLARLRPEAGEILPPPGTPEAEAAAAAEPQTKAK